MKQKLGRFKWEDNTQLLKIQLINKITTIVMKVKFLRDIREPLPGCTQTTFSTSGLLIGEEFKQIIDRECPGKLYKLMKQRVRSNWQIQSSYQVNQSNPKQIKVFERTFFRERQRSSQKQRRIHSMRLQLQQRLKLTQRPPSPFFKLSRDNILQMQKISINGRNYIKNKQMHGSIKIHSKSKLVLHPYITLTSKTVSNVSREMKKKFKTINQQITQFSPFGSIQPLEIIY